MKTKMDNQTIIAIILFILGAILILYSGPISQNYLKGSITSTEDEVAVQKIPSPPKIQIPN